MRTRRPIWLAALAALVTFLAIFGLWQRKNAELPDSDAPGSPGGLFVPNQAQGTSLTGVGRILGLKQPCTAWLLDIGGAPDTPALAVTSGRCAGAIDPAVVLTDVKVEGASVEFNAFATLTSAGRPNVVPAAIDEVVWASVRGTDMAVLRLATTYGDLTGLGVRPIAAASAPEQSAEILVAGVPVEGIESDQRFLRGSRCQVGHTADVLENGWLWHDLQASDCSGILGGSEGSAVFNPAGAAVAMVTTTTIGAQDERACALGRPCEVVAGGGTSAKDDTSYMVPVGGLAGCFPGGEFTPGGSCGLEDPATVVKAAASAGVAKPGSTVELRVDDPGQDEAEAADQEGTAAEVRQGRLGVIDCRVPDDEDVAVPPDRSAAGSVYVVTLPTDEGFSLACVGPAGQPTELVIEADGTPPDAGSIALTTTQIESGVQVEPVFDPPELSRFRWVSGPAGAIDCATAEGYVEYGGVPATIQAADQPSTVCVIGIDAAGNESVPAAIEVE